MDEEKQTLATANAHADPVRNEDAAGLAQRFRELVQQWKQDTRFCSSLTDMTEHPGYQQIIGLGKEAIPLILDELRREPDYWFSALKALTGEDQVPLSDRGKVRLMTHAWLDWGKQHGF